MEVIVSDHFADKKGDPFQIVFEEGISLDLTLDSIDIKTSVDFPGKTRDPFSLIFSGTPGCCCEQGIYRLRHGSGWEFEVFLVPIAELPGRIFQYQAVYG